MNTPLPLKTVHWARHGHLWLVIAGPALVVVAAFVTAYLAWSHPDPVVDPNYYQQGLKLSQMPDMQGRNHAATAQIPTPASLPTLPTDRQATVVKP
jgi:uncharacterized protein